MKTAYLEFKNVCKKFGKVIANDSVSFSVNQGSIHALVGENGAGKSTLMKILFGMYPVDSGEIWMDGKPVQFPSSAEAKQAGLGMVHQHFMLASELTPLQHVFLDQIKDRNKISDYFKPLDEAALLKELEVLCQEYQLPVPWNRLVSELSVGIQQRVEILRILYNGGSLLILDEPTAVLTPQEILAFFAQLRKLKAAGKTIIIVTHKLKEVVALADEVTVFRSGKVVATKPVSETSITELSELMIGRHLQPTATREKPNQSLGAVLEIKDLTTDRLQSVSLTIHPGEILGLAGVEGNGQTELLQILLNPAAHKFQEKIRWKDKSIATMNALEMRKNGLAYLPEDRLSQGVLTSQNLVGNFLLGHQWEPQFQKNGWLDQKALLAKTEEAIAKMDVRPKDPSLAMENFSGGNQQKFVVAREMAQQPALLLAAQPTRGVDIGASEKIHAEILMARAKGAAVLLVSSDLEELFKLSDRIAVIFAGKILGYLDSAPYDELQVGRWMAGQIT